MTCVSPHPSEYDETAHVLRYAAIASQIKVAAGLMAAPEPEAPPAKRKRGARGEEEEGAQAGKGEGARQGTAMRIGVGERQLRARLEEARERMAFLEEENEDLRLELNNLKVRVAVWLLSGRPVRVQKRRGGARTAPEPGRAQRQLGDRDGAVAGAGGGDRAREAAGLGRGGDPRGGGAGDGGGDGRAGEGFPAAHG